MDVEDSPFPAPEKIRWDDAHGPASAISSMRAFSSASCRSIQNRRAFAGPLGPECLPLPPDQTGRVGAVARHERYFVGAVLGPARVNECRHVGPAPGNQDRDRARSSIMRGGHTPRRPSPLAR